MQTHINSQLIFENGEAVQWSKDGFLSKGTGSKHQHANK